MIGVPAQQYRKKPTMQQTELADLHFVDAKRIKELGNAAELPAYRTMVRCLDETSVEKNREQLEALLRAFFHTRSPSLLHRQPLAQAQRRLGDGEVPFFLWSASSSLEDGASNRSGHCFQLLASCASQRFVPNSQKSLVCPSQQARAALRVFSSRLPFRRLLHDA